MALIKTPQGTHDLLPDGAPTLKVFKSARAHQHVVEVSRRVLERAGAQPITTPLFEEADVIVRGVGGSTDIVRKEMFQVHYAGTSGGYILRPEATAPVVRAYLENGLKQLGTPLRLWMTGPIFRAERQQANRYRQFHQVDYEAIGSGDPIVDAEAIALMARCFAELGVTGVDVKLGSVGDPEDRARYNAYLRELFGPHEARLSTDSKDRLTRNPMRILDSKSKEDQELVAELAPRPMLDFLGDEAAAHFAAVRGFLDTWGVPYSVDPTIVRGLDYYNRTAWEMHHANIGAKSALGGGGRYDGLAETLGGPRTPAVGFAFGVERVLNALEQEGARVTGDPERMLLYVAALDGDYVARAARIAFTARASGVAEFAPAPRRPGKAIQEALKKGARYVAFLGSEEAARDYVSIKDLDTGVQMPVPLSVLDDILRDRLSLVSSNIADIVLHHLMEHSVLNAFGVARSVFGPALGALASFDALPNAGTLEVRVTLNPNANVPRAPDEAGAALAKSVRGLWNFFDLEAE